MSDSPLHGLRVLELARVLAGPWAGQLLADLGADVIKVEAPGGDQTRQWGPPFVESPSGARDAAYFHAANRGKRSVVIDFSTPAGQAEVRRLAADADVLIENFKVGSLKKYRLDYESLAKENPRLVYCSITGFGQDGPYASRPGYDFVIQGMSGVMDLTGESDGPPQKMGVAFGDIFAGLYAVIGIQAALEHRGRSGRGQHVDISLLDAMVGVLANQGMNYLVSGVSPERLGNRHPNIAPYEALPTLDGWFVLAVGSDAQFRRFCAVVELQALADDPRYATNQDRVRNRDALSASIAAATKRRTSADLLDALERHKVPAGPINTVEQALTDSQIAARGLLLSLTRAADGAEIPGIRTPIRFSDAELTVEQPSPLLDENNEANWRQEPD